MPSWPLLTATQLATYVATYVARQIQLFSQGSSPAGHLVAGPARCLIFFFPLCLILSHTTKSSEGKAGAAVCVGVSRHGTADTNAAQVSQVDSKIKARLDSTRVEARGSRWIGRPREVRGPPVQFESLCQPVGARGVRKAWWGADMEGGNAATETGCGRCKADIPSVGGRGENCI